MPKVQVDVPVEVHGLLRVEAARRGLSLARCVVALVGEALGPKPETVSVPARVVGRRVVRPEEPGKPFEVKPARVPVGEFDRVSREVVESEWKPAPGLSKAEQAKRGRK